ncbi:MAG: CYTH domain-containing protein [Cytophagaceae bacterium]|jgi:CYTH domain-containing protein|nr:CYTH domain-containing protein [Cytophagaceae bacterium]
MEIERKFLVKNDYWLRDVQTVPRSIRQGYLHTDADKTIRVRTKGDKGYLTIKGKTTGISRPEWEIEIPWEEAMYLLDSYCQDIIEKERYEIIIGRKTWEVDVFSGTNSGLILAEIELISEDEKIDLPDWIGEEVSTDVRYTNAYLCKHPYKSGKARL